MLQDSEAFSLQDWVQLSNGCACCTVKNDFVKALEELMTRKGMYDYILIETTGVVPAQTASGVLCRVQQETKHALETICMKATTSHEHNRLTRVRN